MNKSFEHIPVLFNECIDALNIKSNGIYVDGTFGLGGHCAGILNKLNTSGRVFAFDKDSYAINYANTNIKDDRLTIIQDTFANMISSLQEIGINKVDGILLDLGVSSIQLDDHSRGFAYNIDKASPDIQLDMRMNQTSGIKANQWLNTASEKEIADIIWKYSQEKFSKKIANKIVNVRRSSPISTVQDLIKILQDSIMHKDRYKHFAKRTFQAIRIHINNELNDLENFLQAIFDTKANFLNHNARIVIISFHSLEDTLVKSAFKAASSKENSKFKIIKIQKKPTPDEIKTNPRSRSAIVRCIEYTDQTHVANNVN